VRTLPLPTCARRMAVLICLVCAIDVAAVFLTAKPQLWNSFQSSSLFSLLLLFFRAASSLKAEHHSVTVIVGCMSHLMSGYGCGP
jgi:hypothetical protein